MDFVTEAIAIGNSRDATAVEKFTGDGITAVLNTAFDLDVSYSNKTLCRFGFEYEKVGLIDGPRNELATLVAAVYMLDQLLRRHKRVLVHCYAGASRSPTVVALYLAFKSGVDFDRSLRYVKVCRRQTNPNDALLALAKDALVALRHNRGFTKRLLLLE